MYYLEFFDVISKVVLRKIQLAHLVVRLQTRKEIMEALGSYLVRVDVQLLKVHALDLV